MKDALNAVNAFFAKDDDESKRFLGRSLYVSLLWLPAEVQTLNGRFIQFHTR
jgi:hypothetical protein